jgi:hypothetical protein
MYEPKYRLNKKDATRWHQLCTRHCLEGFKPNRKFPALTPEENAEFERLTRKRDRKVASHPRCKAARRRARRLDQKTAKLKKRLSRLLNKGVDSNK